VVGSTAALTKRDKKEKTNELKAAGVSGGVAGAAGGVGLWMLRNVK